MSDRVDKLAASIPTEAEVTADVPADRWGAMTASQTAAQELTEACVRLDRALRKRREGEMRSLAKALNVIAEVVENAASSTSTTEAES